MIVSDHYLVVIFCVNNSSKDVVGHFLFERVLDSAKIAIRIVDLSDNVAHDVDHRVIPLAVEFKADCCGLRGNITRTLQVFGNGDLGRLLRFSVAVRRVDFSKQFASFGIYGPSLTKRANIDSIVEPKSIDPVIAEQQQSIIDNVLPDLRPAVVRTWTEASVGAVAAIQI